MRKSACRACASSMSAATWSGWSGATKRSTMAATAGLDLVEVAPNADPPVCKILDYGKFKYEEQKKKNEARKKQKIIEVKEIKLRPSIDDHDYEVKMRGMNKFIEEGDKVKVTMRFRGRELAHQDIGMNVLMRVRDDLDADRQGRADAAHGRPPDGHGDGAKIGGQPPLPALSRQAGKGGTAAPDFGYALAVVEHVPAHATRTALRR